MSTNPESERPDESGDLRRWAEGFRHAADNRHYHLDRVTARETAARFDRAADQIADLRARLEAAERETERLRKIADAAAISLDCATRRLADMPLYPYPNYKMTSEEQQIAHVAEHCCGALMFIRRTLEDSGLEPSANAGGST